MFENYDDILTVEEACEALKIGYNAMYALLNTGELITPRFAYRRVRISPLGPK